MPSPPTAAVLAHVGGVPVEELLTLLVAPSAAAVAAGLRAGWHRWRRGRQAGQAS